MRIKTDNSIKNFSSSFTDNNKVTSSTPNDKEKVVKKGPNKEDLLVCKHCSYKCKKESSLDKHMITKHQEHPCKACHEKCSTFIELLKHVANHHFEEKAEVPGEQEVTVKTEDLEQNKTN